jgi:CubicO group peptidase (beta-lactamase class C family)
MKIRLIYFAILASLLCPRVLGQEKPDISRKDISSKAPASSSSSLHGRYEQSHSSPLSRATLENLDSIVAAFMQGNHVPGLAACIVTGEEIAWEGYYGLANISTSDSVDSNTVFMLASISKTVTGSALMQLFEHGRFQLDDSINAYLPFPVRNPYFPWAAITFRNLLTHSSSIRDNFSNYPYYWGSDPQIALGMYLKEYLTPGKTYYSSTNYSSTSAPGTSVSYCNIGASLCGYLVEVISGVPFDQYCRDSIFAPLGMTNTAWFLRDLDVSLIAHPYAWNGSSNSDYGHYGYASYPDGELRTTVRSLAKWLSANINSGRLGNVRVLDSATVRLMRTVNYQLPPWGGSDIGQGLIWFTWVFPNGRRIWYHDGRDFGVSTTIELDETRKTGIIILTNVSPINEDDFASLANTFFTVADGLVIGVSPEKRGPDLPTKFGLSQNYPNPFNPSTSIRYTIAGSKEYGVGSMETKLMVYDLLGREVAVLVNEKKAPGDYEVKFDASGLSTGVYIYRLTSGQYVECRKMVLMK